MFNKYFISKAFSLLLIVVCCKSALGQNVGINSNGSAPDVSAGLDVNFSNKGLLIPRVTLTGTADVSTIPNRTVSLLVYNSASDGTVPDNVVPGYYFWNGTKWVGLATGAANQWTTNGTTVFYNSGQVGIGTSSIHHSRVLEVLGEGGMKKLTLDYMNDIANNLPSLVFGNGGSGEGIGSRRGGAGENSYGLDFFTNNLSRMTVTNSGNIGIGTKIPNSSAALDVSASDKGLLIPNISLTSTGSSSPISNPYRSLLVYNTATVNDVNPGYYYWNTTYWARLGEGSSGANSWTVSGANIYKNNPANVGIGNSSPSELLDVGGNSIFGSTANSGRLNISNSVGNGALATDIYTSETDRTLRLSNAGTASVGASLQLKPGSENYLFSFEGRGGFRYFSRNGSLGETFKVADNGSVKINTVTSSMEKTALSASGNINDFYQINIQNQSSDAAASSNFVATTNNGMENGGYIKMGIRSSNFNKGTILNGGGKAYLYSNAGTLAIGNSSFNNPLIFFTNLSDGSSGGSDAAGTERLRIAASGNVGVGDFSAGDPNFRLTIDGDTGPKISGAYDLGSTSLRWKSVYSGQISSAGSVEPSATDNYDLGSSGLRWRSLYVGHISAGTIEPYTTEAHDLGSSGLRWRTIFSRDVLNISDRRLKTNIVNSTYGLEEILQLQPVTYNWKKTPDTDKQVGLIAQDVRTLIPEVVKGDESIENLSMNYSALVPVLINAIKEQQNQIEELKKQVKALQK